MTRRPTVVILFALMALVGVGCGDPSSGTDRIGSPPGSPPGDDLVLGSPDGEAAGWSNDGRSNTTVDPRDATDSESWPGDVADASQTADPSTAAGTADASGVSEADASDAPETAGGQGLVTHGTLSLDDRNRLGGAEITRTQASLPTIDLGLPEDDAEEEGTEDEGFTISIPERFVMAYVPNSTPGLPYPTLEVRVSPDGEHWSAPTHPLTADCGVPIPVNWNIAPGLAANANHYLVAAYGANGHLYFSKSRNGVEWQAAMGTTWEQSGLTSESRPSVVYDYDDEVWYALMVTESSNGHSVSLMDLDGVTTQFAHVPLVNFDSMRSPSIVHTGVAGKRYVAVRSFPNGWSQPPEHSFRFYEALPFDVAGVSFPLLQKGFSFETSVSTMLSGNLGQIFMATSHDVPAGSLTTGRNRVWELDPSTEEWSFLVELGRAAPSHEGAALAGVRSHMVVGSPDRNGNTDLWHVSEDDLGVMRAHHQPIDTRSIKPVGLAFGPKNGRAPLPNECSAGADHEDPLRSVFLRFRWFKRTIPSSLGDFEESEDVVLAVAHKTGTGFVDQEGQIGFVSGATKNQGHDFNEGDRTADLPSWDILMQPGEVVTITMKGDDGSSTVDITYDELATLQPGGVAKTTHTRHANGVAAYQVRYDAGVSKAQ